jgi:hypothetical protein
MERGLLVLVFVVGVVLCGLSLWLPPRARIALPSTRLRRALGLALGAALLTVPSGGYFGLGGHLGIGCALGALGAGLSAWLSAEQTDFWRRRISGIAPIFLILPLLLLFFRSSLFDALGGALLGWLGVGFLAGVEISALALPAVLLAGVGIAGYRGAPAGEMAALLLLGAGGALFSLLSKLWAGWRGWLGFGLLFALEARWLVTKVAVGDGKLLWAVVAGSALAVLLSKFSRTDPPLERFASVPPRQAMGILPWVLVLAGHVVGSHLGGAYGATLLTVALLTVHLFLFEEIDVSVLGLAALLVLYRWLPLRWPELRLGFTDHHALPGLLLGALVPGLTKESERGRLAGGVLAAVVVVGALTLLGVKAALPLGVGLALGVLRERASLGLALVALAALIQFAGHVLPVVELGRVVRMEVLAGLAVLGGAAWWVLNKESDESR